MARLGIRSLGTKELALADLLPEMQAIGYHAVELMALPQYQADPASLDARARRDLVTLHQDLGLVSPVLATSVPAFATGEKQEHMRAQFGEVCQLARDLYYGVDKPIVTFDISGPQPSFDKEREQIVAGLLPLADIAAAKGCVLAIKPGIRGPLRSPERLVWLMETANHPALRLNLDVVAFTVRGYDMEQTTTVCSPYTVYTYVKDAIVEDEELYFLLPGEGDFDFPCYFGALAKGGFDGVICVDIPDTVLTREDYDPVAVAEFSYPVLAEALEVMDL